MAHAALTLPLRVDLSAVIEPVDATMHLVHDMCAMRGHDSTCSHAADELRASKSSVLPAPKFTLKLRLPQMRLKE